MYAFGYKFTFEKRLDSSFGMLSRLPLPEKILTARKMNAEDFYVRAHIRFSKKLYGGAFGDICKAIAGFEAELKNKESTSARALLASSYMIRRKIHVIREDMHSADSDAMRALRLNPSII